MTEETREVINWFIGMTIGMSTIAGLLVRFVLLPYLKEHIVDPMKTVKRQVSENHHSNTKPTILDGMGDVQREIREFRSEMLDLAEEMRSNYQAVSTMYEGHMSWSDRWVNLIEREIDVLKRALGK